MNALVRTKVFRSGNSMAVRLPKALGFTEGTEMEIVDDGSGGVHIRPVRRKIDLSDFAGKCPWLTPQPREDLADPPRIWDDPDFPGFPAA